MTAQYTPIHEIAQMHTEPFVKGLEAGLEVVGQYRELGRPVTSDDISTESDAVQVAINRLAMSDDVPKTYGELEYGVMGMGVVAALEESVVRAEKGGRE